MNLLRIVACGSVDDGKSTLLGRLLHDLGALTEDQIGDIRVGPDQTDFSLAFDGLAAEREQGITIDVAYRSVSSSSRRFIVADVPGHEQYTRNMVTGASTAELALLVVDATSGMTTQTRRHTYLAWLLGIRHFLVAVNKMDLVDFDRNAFSAIAADYATFVRRLGQAQWHAIPVSARLGDNVVERSARTNWFTGPTIIEALHDVTVAEEAQRQPFRFPVQMIDRSRGNGRAYAGTIATGTVSVGDRIKIQPSDQQATIAGMEIFTTPLERAVAGQSIAVTLDKEVDIGRGHIICAADAPATVADSFQAVIIWMGDKPLVRGRSYWLKIGTKTVPAQIVRVTNKTNCDDLSAAPAEALSANEIGVCHVRLDELVAFDPYEENRQTGGFILIDRISNDTIAAGLVRSGELQFRDIPWQSVEVTKASRAALNNHPPAVLWFTGIPSAGKSTIANLVEKMLCAKGRHTYLLDGDNIRHGLNRDLGFSDADRVENIRRVAEVARLMADAGLIVLVALIAPFRAERRRAREKIGTEFVEIFVDTPLDVAEARDSKGHYRRARNGELSGFTGIGSGYEAPERPELHIDTTTSTPEEAALAIVEYLLRREAAGE